MASESYMRKALPEIYDELYVTLYNLSHVLGDVDGLIPSLTSAHVARNLQVNQSGLITSSIPIPKDTRKTQLGAESFSPRVSLKAWEVYSGIDTKSSALITDEGTLSVLLDTGFKPDMQTIMSYLYLELFAVYRSMVEYDRTSLFPISADELSDISSNLRFIAQCVEEVGNGLEVYETLSFIRFMQRGILLISDTLPRIVR
jgi:hypothetical protein